MKAADLFAGFDSLTVMGNPILEQNQHIAPATGVIPKEWSAGLASLDRLPQPYFLTPYEWKRLISDAQSFGRLWAPQAHALGWTVQELFGCPHNVARSIYLPSGIVYLLEGRNVGEIHADQAAILNRTGAPHTYRRDFDRSSIIPIWEAFRSLKP